MHTFLNIANIFFLLIGLAVLAVGILGLTGRFIFNNPSIWMNNLGKWLSSLFIILVGVELCMGSLSRLLKLPWLDTHYLITGGSGMILLSLIGFELIIGRPKLGYPIPVNEGRKIILGAWFIIAGAGFLMIPIENYLSIFPVPVNSIFTIGLILLLAFLTNKLHKQQKQSISSDG